jgi:sialate O-acetylesterase
MLLATPCLADVRLPKVLGSKMVLQRNSEVRIWGSADAGETIQLTGDWFDKPLEVNADSNGQWEVRLPTREAGGPHTLKIVGRNTITLQDLLFGEAWIASGQSNMEMPLVKVSDAYTGIQDGDQEVKTANHPQIRLFQAGNVGSRKSLEDVAPGPEMYGIPPARCEWMVCSPETVPHFASTAYFFARELHRQLQVPIGIIDASWGGTPAEAWTPLAGLERVGDKAAVEQALNAPDQGNQPFPTRLYNGMIHPLRKLKIQGAIWYQGEGNTPRADKYRELFATMIGQWRKEFDSEFSFYFVQIAPFNYGGVNSAYLREAQRETLSTAKTGMVVTLDIGNLTDIHPKNKQEVGRRLALWALAKDYGREIAFSGPLYKQCRFQDGQARVRFDLAASGLATRDGQAPSHFTIAGEDKVFHPATATIEGDEIVVTSDKVPQPRAVRYAFTNDAVPNLINRDGLPASSFRTDDWPQ